MRGSGGRLRKTDDPHRTAVPRTECACAACTQCCRDYPGHLIPGDLERIADFMSMRLEEAQKFFWASRGALVMDTRTGVVRRIGTITPRYDRRKKRCVFLDDQSRCLIHAVAPFGCAYADTHMTDAMWQERGMWALTLIDDPAYKAQRAELPFADVDKPVK